MHRTSTLSILAGMAAIGAAGWLTIYTAFRAIVWIGGMLS